MAIDTPAGIRNGYQRPLYAVRSNDMYRLIRDLRVMEPGADCYAFGEYAHLALSPENSKSIERVRQYLIEKEHTHIEVLPADATVEDCFIDLMDN